MLLALAAVVAGLIAALATGRRPSRHEPDAVAANEHAHRGQHWRGPLLIAAGAVLQVTGQHFVAGLSGRIVMDAGYACLLAFAAANARRTGLLLIAAGLAANLLVIVVDGGMPVRDQPAAASLGDQHHGLSRSDHLTFLADTIHVRPLGETVSPGDVVAALGAGVAIFAWLEPPTGARRRRTPRPSRHRRTQPAAGSFPAPL